MDIPGIVEYSNLRPLDCHIVYVPFYMPGEHPKFAEDDQVFLDKVKRYFKKINPALTDDDFIALHASRYRHAQPICELTNGLSMTITTCMQCDEIIIR